MIASQSRKSARRARHLSTGHGRPRSDFQLAFQVAPQLIIGEAILRSFISRFTVEQRIVSTRSKSTSLPAALKSP
jgi:hypothetical protein